MGSVWSNVPPGVLEFGILFVFGIFLYKTTYIVREGKCMVLERFGKFSRIAESGIHWIPLESPKRYRWGHQIENASGDTITELIVGEFIELNNGQLDCIPFDGVSHDGVSVSVNGALHYKITDPRQAIYETDELLHFLEDCVSQATRVICRDWKYDDLVSGDYKLASAMLEEINNQCRSYGVVCSKFMIQGIQCSPEIANAKEQQLAAHKEAETKRKSMESAHEIAMQELDYKRKRQETEAELETQQVAHKAKMAKMETDAMLERDLARVEAEAARIRNLVDAGLPGNTIPSYCFAKSTRNVKKIIMSNGAGNLILPQIE
jgi:regulator of protease activity HflC (stomatin/prohibitin superfamily)